MSSIFFIFYKAALLRTVQKSKFENKSAGLLMMLQVILKIWWKVGENC